MVEMVNIKDFKQRVNEAISNQEMDKYEQRILEFEHRILENIKNQEMKDLKKDQGVMYEEEKLKQRVLEELKLVDEKLKKLRKTIRVLKILKILTILAMGGLAIKLFFP